MQIALFVAPLLVFVSLAVGNPLTLSFNQFELLALGAAVGIAGLISLDGGRTGWKGHNCWRSTPAWRWPFSSFLREAHRTPRGGGLRDLPSLVVAVRQGQGRAGYLLPRITSSSSSAPSLTTVIRTLCPGSKRIRIFKRLFCSSIA